MALPKAYRLKRRYDFEVVYQKGLRFTGTYLTLRALRSRVHPSQAVSSPQPCRIGISISRKVSKQAVVRNRIKRQLRAGLRQFLPDLVNGWQLVIVVKPAATECDYFQFLQELEQLLVQAEVLHGHS